MSHQYERVSVNQSHVEDYGYTSADNLLTSEESGASTRVPKFPAPKDRFYGVYWIFYFLGIGSLAPWNFFITAEPYFQWKMRDLNATAKSEETQLQRLFENYLILASTVPNVIFQIINVYLTRSVSQKVRLSSAIVTMIFVFLLTDLLALMDTDHWQGTFFALTMFSVVISNSGQSMYCGALFGIASMFPPEYMGAAMSGQALGGTVAALVNILTIAGATSVRISAIFFFISATVILFLCLFCYIALFYIKYSKYHLQRHVLGLDCSIDTYTSEDGSILYSDDRDHIRSFGGVCKALWPYATSVFLCFLVTLSLFPAVFASISSVNKANGSLITNIYFIPVVCFLLFNTADFVGRQVSARIQCIKSYNTWCLVLLSAARVGFIPLFLFCNIEHSRFPLVFNNDAYVIVFILFHGLSNGYLSTLAMMYGPEKIPLKWVELAGGILSLCLSLGLALGSSLSLGLVQLIHT